MIKYIKSKTGATLHANPTELLGLLDHKASPLNRESQLDMALSTSSASNEFRGGTLSQVRLAPDMRPFLDSLADLRKNPSLAVLRPVSANVSQSRRRVKSEYDGDYDLDKRWDIKPFNSTERKASATPYIKVMANMSVLCKYSADQISQYGTLVWAIIQVLESRSIRVSVNATFNSIQSTGFDAGVNVLVKDTLTYTSPQALAHVFTANYVRRAMFNGLILAADHCNSAVDYALGKAVNNSKSVLYDKSTGMLHLDIGALNNYNAVTEELTRLFEGS